MSTITYHSSTQTSRNSTDYQTRFGCQDCWTVYGAIHNVVKHRGPGTISATYYVDGVEAIELGTFHSITAATRTLTRLHVRFTC